LNSASARSAGSTSAFAIVDDPASRLPAAIWDVPRLNEREGVEAIEEDVANDFFLRLGVLFLGELLHAAGCGRMRVGLARELLHERGGRR